MIDTPSVDWFALSPSLAALVAAAICLLSGAFMPRWILRPFAAFFCALGFIGGGALALLVYIETPHGSLEVADAIFRDRYAAFTQILVMGAGLLTVFVSYSARMRQDHIGEYYALLVTAGAGMAFLVQSANLMTLFLGLEWFSVCLYILCAIEIDLESSLEAGLKYLIIGGMGSAVLLFGSALIYGATGELGFSAIADATQAQNLSGDPLLLVGLAMLLAGLAFKSSAAPFHMWTPDVYEGAPTPVTGFMAAATKTVALVLMYRVLLVAFPEERDVWTIAVAVAGRDLARVGQHRRARPVEHQAAPRVLLDLARGLHADRRLLGERARRARAPLLPDPVRARSRSAPSRSWWRANASSASPSRSTTSPASAGSGRCSASRWRRSCSASPGSR